MSRKYKVMTMLIIVVLSSVLIYNEKNVHLMYNIEHALKMFNCGNPDKVLPHNISFQSATLEELDEYLHIFVEQTDFHCTNMTRVGLLADGGWDMCVQEPFMVKHNQCLVYSFGINNHWDFDDGMDKRFGCTVKSYDPSMTANSHNRSTNIEFIKIGLKGLIPNAKWTMKSFGQLLEANGHTKLNIDMLKFDIEGSEWGAITDMIKEGSLNNVKQMAFEVHFSKKPTRAEYKMYISTLQNLQSIDFIKWRSHHNVFNYHIGNVRGVPTARWKCWELMFINKKFMYLK